MKMGDSCGEGHWDFPGPTRFCEPIYESTRDSRKLGFGKGVREGDQERKEGHVLQVLRIPGWEGLLTLVLLPLG